MNEYAFTSLMCSTELEPLDATYKYSIEFDRVDKLFINQSSSQKKEK